MKTFQSKNLHDSRTVGLLKGLTLLFLGASVAVLATYGLTIDPSINNSVQYIQKIILTSDGTQLGTTGIVLDGGGGVNVNGTIKIGPTIGAQTGLYLLWGLFGGSNSAVIYAGNGGGAGHNGNILLNPYGQPAGGVAIGKDNPQATLDVNGSGKFAGNVIVDGKVGIGTGASAYKLDVNGTGKFNGLYVNKVDVSAVTAGTIITNIITTNLISSTSGPSINFNNSNISNVGILTGGTGNFAGNVIVNGKVGIGIPTPQAKLDVSGDLRVSYSSARTGCTSGCSSPPFVFAATGVWQCPNDGVMKGLRVVASGTNSFEILCSSD